MEQVTQVTESPPRSPEAVLAGIMQRIGERAAADAKATPSFKETGKRGQDAPAVEMLPAGPFTAVCGWLRSRHLTLEHGQNTDETPAVLREKDGDKHPAKHPEPEVPPYVLRLVSLLERIGDGTADDSDRQRLAAWLPNGIFNARLVHRRDLAAGAVLLAELGVLT